MTRLQIQVKYVVVQLPDMFSSMALQLLVFACFRVVCWKTIHHQPVDSCRIPTSVRFRHPHVRLVHAGILHQQVKGLFPCLLKSLGTGNNSDGRQKGNKTMVAYGRQVLAQRPFCLCRPQQLGHRGWLGLLHVLGLNDRRQGRAP